MAKLIDGKAIAQEIRHELKDHIVQWISDGHRAPHLTAVLIGDDPASHTYVNNKIKVNKTLFLRFFLQIFKHFFLQIFQHFFCFIKFIGRRRSWNLKRNKTLSIDYN